MISLSAKQMSLDSRFKYRSEINIFPSAPEDGILTLRKYNPLTILTSCILYCFYFSPLCIYLTFELQLSLHIHSFPNSSFFLSNVHNFPLIVAGRHPPPRGGYFLRYVYNPAFTYTTWHTDSVIGFLALNFAIFPIFCVGTPSHS
jgi:hypothetical protein